MEQLTRTLVFIGVAAVVSLAAVFVTWPAAETVGGESVVGQPLFPKFDDPQAARRLEIVTFDENTSELRDFQVAQVNGLWVIPSEGDYPADAAQQMGDAAASLLGLEIVGIASESARDHAELGVIEPNKTKLSVGDKDVGTMIVLKDSKNDDLVRLIVGKEVEGESELRFVRKPDQEVVYVSKIDLSKFPTQFDKWIEKDLLKLNTFDVARVTLKDYSVVPGQRGFSYSGRMEAAADWNAEKSAWELDEFKVFSRPNQEWVSAPLGDYEELNSQKLNDLKTALDDLQIVDVVKKPAGLSEGLKAGADILGERDLMESLMLFGFLPARPPGAEKLEIVASNGEVAVDTKDGVQYILRFGNVSGAQEQSGEKSADDELKLNRYLFVTAQLSPHTLVEPTYEPEPAGPAPAADAPLSGDPAAAEPAAGDSAKTDGAKTDAAQIENAGSDPAAGDAAKPADPQAVERDRIKRENDRKRNDYNEKRKKAVARVAELNARFADWYYVISEDVYKKIHLGRSDIIREDSEARVAGFDVDAFRKLESDGVEKTTPVESAPAAPMTPNLPPFN
jgi:hypothetical protein